MLKNKFFNNDPRVDKSLSDLNLLWIWSEHSGSDWSATIKEECLAALNQPTEEKEPESNNGMTLLGIVAALALFFLGVITWYQAPRIAQACQEMADTVSSDLLTLTANR